MCKRMCTASIFGVSTSTGCLVCLTHFVNCTPSSPLRRVFAPRDQRSPDERSWLRCEFMGYSDRLGLYALGVYGFLMSMGIALSNNGLLHISGRLNHHGLRAVWRPGMNAKGGRVSLAQWPLSGGFLVSDGRVAVLSSGPSVFLADQSAFSIWVSTWERPIVTDDIWVAFNARPPVRLLCMGCWL